MLNFHARVVSYNSDTLPNLLLRSYCCGGQPWRLVYTTAGMKSARVVTHVRRLLAAFAHLMTGRAAPTTAAREIKRRWWVKKEVVRRSSAGGAPHTPLV